MAWAKEWTAREGWRHKLRVMCGYDAERIDYHWENVRLDRLARMWKSHLAEDAFEKQDSPGGKFRLGPPSR